jgi:O-antigen/teichoic acid export membrane protein
MKAGKRERRDLFKDLSIYSLAHGLSEGLCMVRGLLLANILGPALFGLWTLVKVILFYSNLVGLGSVEAYNREGPFFRGGNQQERTRTIEENVFSFLLVGAAVAMVILAAVGMGIRLSGDPLKGAVVILLGPVILLQQLYQFCLVKMRSERQVARYSGVEGMFGALSLTLTVGLGFFWGLYGALGGLIGSYALLLVYLRFKGVFVQRWSLDPGVIRGLIRIGFPIMVQGFLFFLLKSVDVLMVMVLMDRSHLGYYGVAFFMARGIALLPSVLNTILYPKMMEEFGRTKDVSGLEKYVRHPTEVMIGLLPVFLGALFLLLPHLITIFLPRYVEGITATRVLCLAIYFLMAAPMAVQTLVAVNKQWMVVRMQAAAGLLNALLDFIFIKAGWGIAGVAWGTAISYLVFGISSAWVARSLFAGGTKEKTKFCASIILPFGYWISLLLLVEALARVPFMAGFPWALRLAIQLVCFFVLLLPFLGVWDRKTAFRRWAADVIRGLGSRRSPAAPPGSDPD